MSIRNDWTAHLLRYSLKELRQRQNITKQQIAVAYQNHNERALTQLNDMLDSLAETINVKFCYESVTH